MKQAYELSATLFMRAKSYSNEPFSLSSRESTHGNHKLVLSRQCLPLHTWVFGKSLSPPQGLDLDTRYKYRTSKTNNKNSSGLDLKRKVSGTTGWWVWCQTVSWEGAWNILEPWRHLEFKANRCLNLLERCWDIVPKGLWVPLGTKTW